MPMAASMSADANLTARCRQDEDAAIARAAKEGSERQKSASDYRGDVAMGVGGAFCLPELRHGAEMLHSLGQGISDRLAVLTKPLKRFFLLGLASNRGDKYLQKRIYFLVKKNNCWHSHTFATFRSTDISTSTIDRRLEIPDDRRSSVLISLGDLLRVSDPTQGPAPVSKLHTPDDLDKLIHNHLIKDKATHDQLCGARKQK
jgi:hypothetical protein